MRTQAGIKNLRAIKALLMVAALSHLAPAWAAPNEEATSAPAPVAQEVAATKAYLTLDDLKTLLGLKGQTVSLTEGAEAATGSYDFILSLSKNEKRSLRQMIRRTERTRAQLSAQLAKDLATQKAEMRRQRRQLQASRLSAGDQSDETLSRSIFESLLSESNVEARSAQQLEAFDQAHLVSIEFDAVEGRRVVNTIAMGDELVWSVGSLSRVAAK